MSLNSLLVPIIFVVSMVFTSFLALGNSPWDPRTGECVGKNDTITKQDKKTSDPEVPEDKDLEQSKKEDNE